MVGEKGERGTYQRVLVSTGPTDWTQDTEVEETTVAQFLCASGQDELLKWARAHYYVFDTTVATITEWMLIQCSAADATQDLNASDTIELLLKRGKILKRGWHIVPAEGYGTNRKIQFEVFNVPLNDGEELRLLFRPVRNAGANQMVIGELEYRFAGK